MSEAKEVKVNATLIKAYGALVDGVDAGIRDWWRKASKTPKRELSETIKEAQKKFPAIRGIKPAYSNNARLAVKAFDIKGADSYAVTDIMKEVEKCQRALGLDASLMLVGEVKDFSEFVAKVESVQKPKKPRAKSQKPVIEGEITAHSIVSMALGLWQELEDATLDTPEAIKQAELFAGLISNAVTYSKGELAKSRKAHPVGA